MEQLAGMGAATLVVIAFLYFIPSVVAAMRHHHQTGPIVALNLLLGWTLLGWVAALVWSLTATPKSDGTVKRTAADL